MANNKRKFHYENLHQQLVQRILIGDEIEKYDNLLEFFEEMEAELDLFNFDELMENFESVKFSKSEVDKNGVALYPDDAEPSLTPIECVGDGNCLYNAVSMLLCHSNNLSLELRIKTVREIMINRISYDREPFCNLAPVSSTGFEFDIVTSIKKNKYSDVRHLAALCNVLNCTIVSIYPRLISNIVKRKDLHTTF